MGLMMNILKRPGIAALALLLSASVSAQAPGQTISIWTFGIAPRPIHLAAGQPVSLVFINRSRQAHDFTARAFFAASTITEGNPGNGKIELGAYATKRLTLIPRRGTYEAHCSHFMHKQMGMSDEIIVE